MTQKSKDIIFSNVKSLAGKTQYSIQEQLPAEVSERRQRLWSKYKEAKSDQTNNVKWNLDKLVINGVSHSALDNQYEIDPNIAAEHDLEIKHTQHEIVDGSTFIGHAADIKCKGDVPIVMAKILQDRSLASATHNIYAFRTMTQDGKIDEGYRDDGEHGAGHRLLKYLRDNDIDNTMTVVTRFFGNKLLGKKRFDCITKSAEEAIQLLDSD